MKPDLDGCLDALRRKGLAPDDPVAVVVVGSVTRGWAHAASDFDLYVLTGAPCRMPGARTVAVPLHPDTVTSVDFTDGGRRYEVTYWTDAQVGQMLEKVTWDAFDSDESSLRILTSNEELFLERLSGGVALTGADWLKRRAEQLHDSAYRAFVATRSLSEADGKVEQALGMLETGDTHSAVLAAKVAFQQATDALLDSHGVYGTHTPKWRARRVQDARLDALPFERYWALETMADFDPQRPEEWVRRTVEFCKDLSLEVEI
ncbi:hypothetical protein SAMN05428945_1729 [Streptomyces sp. 2224.1]|uniref:hypothetical protein n=1 Tax=unclassified Streptomyces TaxID=2593676 RepID=UPI00089CE477|nr:MULTISPECIES: hypothetical protein [unclassified Streptomyces]SEB99118.1 hypothetical protein SAMN05428945_1729 [Streptomyces sp. 2224.1]SEE72745.1 hypothetical protein SAMN05428954_3648 [Streptomyces sp. 2112.3]